MQDIVKKANKNKKRKAGPLVAGVVKAPKVAESTQPKIEPVDAPTKAPTIAKTPKVASAPTKSSKAVVNMPSDSEIQLCYVDRTENAKMVQKTVSRGASSSSNGSSSGPHLSGLEIIDKPTNNAATKSKEFLKWFLWPLPVDEFFNSYWEKRVFVMKRGERKYWDGWFSTGELRDLVDEGRLMYGTDMDMTMYQDQQRFTLNIATDEPAAPEVVWSLFENSKCSIRVLRPQEYASNVSRMLALLEESFLSGFGSNAYYTPKGSQGFAPHWDDVEAFVLQLEGKKKWKIHRMGGQEERLPRFSSRNFSQEEVGETVMEVTLEPGDMLYFPRGTIHQAMSVDGEDSFHLTVSCAQKNCWADLMDIAVNAALIQASKTMPAYRDSLPRDYGNYMGVMHSDNKKDEKRQAFMRTALALIEAFTDKYLPEQIDDAADKMMCRFLYDRQPPQAMLSSEEQGLDAPGSSDMVVSDEEKEENDSAPPALVSTADEEGDEDPIELETKIRLVSKHCCRLVIEDLASLYYASENTAKYHEVDSMKIRMPLEYSEAIEFLVNSYPKYTAVSDLPLETDEEKVDLANELLEHQIAMVE